MALDLTKKYNIFFLFAVIEIMGRIQSSEVLCRDGHLLSCFYWHILVRGLSSKMWDLDILVDIEQRYRESRECQNKLYYKLHGSTGICKYLCSASSDWHLPGKGKINFNVSLPSVKLIEPELMKMSLRHQPPFHIFKDDKIL